MLSKTSVWQYGEHQSKNHRLREFVQDRNLGSLFAIPIGLASLLEVYGVSIEEYTEEH